MRSSALAAPLIALLLVVGPLHAVQAQPAASLDRPAFGPRDLGGRLDEAARLTEDAVGAIQRDGVAEILTEIEQNIARLNGLRERVRDAPHIDAAAGEIAEVLGQVATSYGRIAETAETVFADQRLAMEGLRGVQRQLGYEEKDAAALGDNEARLIAEIQRRLKAGNLSASDRRKLEVSLRAAEIVKANLDAQAEIWGRFRETHAELVGKVDANRQILDEFFHFLKENERIYAAAAETADLRLAARQVLFSLDTFRQIDDLMFRMEGNWAVVEEIMKELREQPFQTPAETPGL